MCERYRDHVVELKLRGVGQADPLGAHAEARERHRAQIVEAVGATLLRDCEQTPESQVECALRAGSDRELRACRLAAREK